MASNSCFGTTNAARSPTPLFNLIFPTQRLRSGKHFVLRYDERCTFSHSSLQFNISYAEMAEWSNAHDSKSCYGQLYGGSNPSLCAKNGEVGQKQIARLSPFLYLIYFYFNSYYACPIFYRRRRCERLVD